MIRAHSTILLIGETTTGSYGDCFRRALRGWGLPAIVAEARTVPGWPWIQRPPMQLAARAFGRVASQVRRYSIRMVVQRASRLPSRLVTLIVGMQRVAPEVLAAAKAKGPVVLFFNDDLETRRGRSAAWWGHARTVLDASDLLVTQRPHRLDAIRRHYGGPVLFQDFAYMESFQRPCRSPGLWLECDIVFVGNHDEDRLAPLEALGRGGLAVHVWGSLWPRRRLCAAGVTCRGYLPGERIASALGRSRAGLCLVRHNNFDYQVMRTFEVPACGTFLLAERTPDHQRLFRDGEEAELFGSTEELVDKASFYARQDGARERIAEAGHRRVLATPNTVRDRLREALVHPVVGLAVPAE
jgi:hypothetical protein